MYDAQGDDIWIYLDACLPFETFDYLRKRAAIPNHTGWPVQLHQFGGFSMESLLDSHLPDFPCG